MNEKQMYGPGTPRIIHAAVSGGLLMLFAVLFFLQTRITLGLGERSERVMQYAGLAVLVVTIIVAQAMRGRIAAPGRSADLDEWWQANLPRAVVVWALAEGGGLAAIVLGSITGYMPLIALGAAVALALLFVSRPGRLEAGS